jgi:hypothetical protein
MRPAGVGLRSSGQAAAAPRRGGEDRDGQADRAAGGRSSEDISPIGRGVAGVDVQPDGPETDARSPPGAMPTTPGQPSRGVDRVLAARGRAGRWVTQARIDRPARHRGDPRRRARPPLRQAAAWLMALPVPGASVIRSGSPRSEPSRQSRTHVLSPRHGFAVRLRPGDGPARPAGVRLCPAGGVGVRSWRTAAVVRGPVGDNVPSPWTSRAGRQSGAHQPRRDGRWRSAGRRHRTCGPRRPPPRTGRAAGRLRAGASREAEVPASRVPATTRPALPGSTSPPGCPADWRA